MFIIISIILFCFVIIHSIIIIISIIISTGARRERRPRGPAARLGFGVLGFRV